MFSIQLQPFNISDIGLLYCWIIKLMLAEVKTQRITKNDAANNEDNIHKRKKNLSSHLLPEKLRFKVEKFYS